jgi:short-subunit dehydrogenase
MAPYVASKFALVGLSDAFRAELARDGITVTTITPGLVRTGSYYQGNFKGQNEKEFAWFAKLSAARLTTLSSERAARQVLDAAREGAPRRTLNYQARILELADRLFPGLVARLMKRANQSMPDPSVYGGEAIHTGFESRSSAAPSHATRLGDQAAERNNQMLAERSP